MSAAGIGLLLELVHSAKAARVRIILRCSRSIVGESLNGD